MVNRHKARDRLLEAEGAKDLAERHHRKRIGQPAELLGRKIADHEHLSCEIDGSRKDAA